MKKTILTSVIALASIFASAQLKVLSGNYSIIGATPASAPTTSKLQVVGNSVFTATTSAITSAAYIRGLNGYSTATTPDYTWFNNDQVGMFHPASNTIGWTISGTERMRLNSSGNFGLNVTNPTYRFDMNGTFRLSTWTSAIIDGTGPSGALVLYPGSNWYLHIGKSTNKIGDLYATHVITDVLTVNSDEKIKENVKNLDNPIESIKQINAVKYNLKDSYLSGIPNPAKTNLKKEAIGFIAQNIMQVYPQLVDVTDSANGIYGVNYVGLIPVLLEAIKQQQSQIENLQTDLSACCTKGSEQRNMNSEGDKSNSGIGRNSLLQNVPNPFSETTLIKYSLADASKKATLYVFDMNGGLIKTFENLSKEKGEITINGGDLKAGMYLYSLFTDGKEVETKRMVLTK